MLVSSIGYFNKRDVSVLNSSENNKKHPVANKGLKEETPIFDTRNLFAEIFNNFKSTFSQNNKDCTKSLNMIA